MRYIGSKDNLLTFIEKAVASCGVTGGTFCDLFAGTTVVGRHFKRRGFHVLSNDLMTYSFAFGKAYLENNAPPIFAALSLPCAPLQLFEMNTYRLEQTLAYLNNLPPECGFIWENYSDEGTQGKEYVRMFFSSANAKRIDAIRNQLAKWRYQKVITENEFYILLAALLEAVPGISNTTGTYAAFLKFWESRSQKTLTLTVPPLVYSEQTHVAYQSDATALVRRITPDVLYLDPPYNTRQYATNYHILETLARWDDPIIYGKSGLRPYKNERSAFCEKKIALKALNDITQQAQCRVLLLSYNNEGIMSHESIIEVLSQRGTVEVWEQDYRRFRSDSDHENRQYKPGSHIKERLYVVKTF